MQKDMHYYGTYAMARAAGLTQEAAKTVATAAQFVDDAAGAEFAEFADGSRIDAEATAHHTVDHNNLLPADQRRVWVPFHFLPGNQGDSFTERLICRKNSPIAQEMVNHHLDWAQRPYGLELVGITAHVLADTFSHHGFSGVSSRRNRVIGDSFTFKTALEPQISDYITDKARKFFGRFGSMGGLFANIKSTVAEIGSGALGHGAVATYPDRPYLEWSFQYEYPTQERVERDNPADFLEGCAALYELFRQCGQQRPEDMEATASRPFDEIKPVVAEILAVQADCDGRIAAWREAARRGRLFAEAEEIPLYGAREAWHETFRRIDESLDTTGEALLDHGVYHFYQAAAAHRTWVLRDLLPAHGLVVG